MCIRDRGGFFRYFTQYIEQLPIRTIDFTDPADVARHDQVCLLYTSDAADERSSVDLGGRRIIKKKTKTQSHRTTIDQTRNKINKSYTNDL